MRVETNTKLVKRNRQIAQYLFFFSFGILILGLFLTNQQAATSSPSSPTTELLLAGILPAVVVVIAFISTMISVRMTNLWVREPRPDVLLRDALKGVSNKVVLYNFYHGTARHVLIAPQGVYSVTTRFQTGKFINTGDQWQSLKSLPSRMIGVFRFDGIGNPTHDAQRDAEHVRKLLATIAPDVPVTPLILFLDPRAQITIKDPVVPVLRAQDKLEPSLKDFLRNIEKDKRVSLSPEQIRAFEEATLPQQA